jgi:hypothetical protein
VSNEKTLKFPSSITQHFKVENIEGDIPSEELASLFYADQRFDFMKGLKFAEEHFLSRPIASFSAVELENFIKDLHRIISHNLILVQNNGGISGKYIEERVFIRKESGKTGLEYEFSLTIYSEHDYNVIKEIYGLDAAENYKTFCSELRKLYEEEALKIIPKPDQRTPEQGFRASKIDLIELIKKYSLEAHPGYAVYLKTNGFSVSPLEAPQKMKGYSQVLAQKIKSKIGPVKIAAFALDLAKIHPFPNRNGALSRLLACCILMSYKIPYIHIDKYKKKFYELMELPIGQYEETEKFLQSCVEEAKKETDIEPMIFNAIQASHMTDSQYYVFNYGNYFDLVTTDKLKTYKMLSLVLAQEDPRQAALEFSKEEIKEIKTQLQMQLDRKVHRKINADYLFTEGLKWKDEYPVISIYCFIRAADFYLQSKNDDKYKASDCYKEAALICFTKGEFESAYDYAQMSKMYFHGKANATFYEFLTALDFVRIYREESQSPKITQNPIFMKGFLEPRTSNKKPSIDSLITKYKLENKSQPMLDKGLRRAADSSCSEDLEIFHKSGANINAQDDNPKIKKTALHWAVIKNHKDCVKNLLAWGARSDIPDADKKTAYDYAKGNPEIFDLIKSSTHTTSILH